MTRQGHDKVLYALHVLLQVRLMRVPHDIKQVQQMQCFVLWLQQVSRTLSPEAMSNRRPGHR